MLQGLTDGVPSDARLLGDAPNALAIAVRLPNGSKVVHRTSFLLAAGGAKFAASRKDCAMVVLN